MNALDVATAGCMLAGGALAFLGGVGLLRFPDLSGRMNAATKPQTLGLLLILVGTALRLGDATAAPALILVVAFQLFTSPVLAATVGRVAYRSGEIPTSGLVADELARDLAERQRRAGDDPAG